MLLMIMDINMIKSLKISLDRSFYKKRWDKQAQLKRPFYKERSFLVKPQQFNNSPSYTRHY